SCLSYLGAYGEREAVGIDVDLGSVGSVLRGKVRRVAGELGVREPGDVELRCPRGLLDLVREHLEDRVAALEVADVETALVVRLLDRGDAGEAIGVAGTLA